MSTGMAAYKCTRSHHTHSEMPEDHILCVCELCMGLAQLQLTNAEVHTQVILWYHQMAVSMASCKATQEILGGIAEAFKANSTK